MREICFRKKSDSRMMRWLGSWFSGIENYPEGGVVRTFSRKKLEHIFDACGVG